MYAPARDCHRSVVPAQLGDGRVGGGMADGTGEYQATCVDRGATGISVGASERQRAAAGLGEGAGTSDAAVGWEKIKLRFEVNRW